MKRYLVSDSERFNAEFPANATLADMAGVTGRFRLVCRVGNLREYRMDGTGYKFAVTTIN